MQRSLSPTPFVLALLALTASLLFALPAAADPPATAALTVDALAEAVEMAKRPKCGPQEDEVSISEFPFFQGLAECDALCANECSAAGGYTLTARFDPRTPACFCTCCVPR